MKRALACGIALVLLGCSKPAVLPPTEPESKSPVRVPVVEGPAPRPEKAEVGAVPVETTVFLREDPGMTAPIRGLLPALPATVVVRFTAPVDQSTFNLQFLDTRADRGHSAVEQEVRWISDSEAEIIVRGFPEETFHGFRLFLGGGKVANGLPVQEPEFWILPPERPEVNLYALSVNGGEPELLWTAPPHLTPRSISPDGRYILLTRPVDARDFHNELWVPYIYDRQAAAFTAYPRAAQQGYWQPRWEEGAVWINGWHQLLLDKPEGRNFLDHMPLGEASVLEAAVSPDKQWLAALRLGSGGADFSGRSLSWADLVLVDLTTGVARIEADAVGWIPSELGPPVTGLMDWAPDSSRLLFQSITDRSPIVFANYFLNPATFESYPVPIESTDRHASITWTPDGRLRVSGAGFFTPDGTPVLYDNADPKTSYYWSEDGRLALVYRPPDSFTLEDTFTRQVMASVDVGAGHLIQLSDDAQHVYYWIDPLNPAPLSALRRST